MPWKLQKDKNGKGWFVINAETGEKKSEKPLPRNRAVSQLRALYVHADDEAKKELSEDQKLSLIRRSILERINGAAHNGDSVQYCPEDYWVRDIYQGYAIVEKNGQCYRVGFSEDGDKVNVVGELIPVEISWIPVSKEVSTAPNAAMGHGPEGTFSVPGVGGAEKRNAKKKRGDKNNLIILKEKSGKYRWITFSSTAYRDSDNEIVSTKALMNDVERADHDKDYGPLRYWHTDGADVGDCDFNMLHGRILIESGTFRNNVFAEKLKDKADKYQISIGFRHPPQEPDSEGVFHTIRRFERSLVPAGRASNTLTKLMITGVDDMASIKEKRDDLLKLLGEENKGIVDSLLASAEETQKEADEHGMSYKAKKKDEEKKKPVKEDVEKPEDEAEEDLDEEEVETEEGAEEEAGTEEEAEEESEEETEEEKESVLVGSLPVNSFIEAVAGALSDALEPYIRSVEEMKESLKELGETRRKENSLKSKEIASTNERLDKTEAALKLALKRVKELESGRPRSVTGYLASQSDDTIVEQKEGPTRDSVGSFIDDFVISQ